MGRSWKWTFKDQKILEMVEEGAKGCGWESQVAQGIRVDFKMGQIILGTTHRVWNAEQAK